MRILYFKRLLLLGIMIFAGLRSYTQSIEVISSDRLMEMIDEHGPKTRVISFWATWCGPCVEELPYLEEIQMSGKAEVIRRVELIDQLSIILKDLRRSEMEELERIEAEEAA